MKTRTVIVSLLAAGALAWAVSASAAPREGMVDVVHIINPALVGDSLRVYVDGRYLTPAEAAAYQPRNVLSTTILKGGRPYIDERIRTMMAQAGSPLKEPPKEAKK
ncbi:MAG: hypothetical protein LBU95_02160 [Rikenellaceae bacterium]|jgi:hypothetical protein|nr:hypothetical protein [Rikenellaceae bacterium]